MTGLAIVLTQSYTTGLDGAAMTTHAFSVGLFIPLIGKYIVNIGLVFFAFTTIIGWNYYGERCMYYLKGLKAVKIYKIYCNWTIYVFRIYLCFSGYCQWMYGNS